MIDDRRLRAGVSLWSMFEQDRALFRRSDTTDVPTRLVIAGSDEVWPALVTPPERASGAWQNTIGVALHTRPRLDLLESRANLTSSIRALKSAKRDGVTRRYAAWFGAESVPAGSLANV
jgi:hypothetical protein